MSGRRSVLERFWLTEWSLSALLGLLLFDSFVLVPLVQTHETAGVLQPIVFSLIVVSGIATTLRKRAVTVFVSTLAVVSLVIRWMRHVHPSVALAGADATMSLVFCLLLAGVTLAQVFRAGPINVHRVQGAVAVYLLLAWSWGLGYTLVALRDPAAFSFPAAALAPEQLFGRLTYFSMITMTTVGYGDVTPVSPVARSLASVEAFVGQLFPAILLARLVSMELYHRQQRER